MNVPEGVTSFFNPIINGIKGFSSMWPAALTFTVVGYGEQMLRSNLPGQEGPYATMGNTFLTATYKVGELMIFDAAKAQYGMR